MKREKANRSEPRSPARDGGTTDRIQGGVAEQGKPKATRIEPVVYRILKSPDLVTWTKHQPAPDDVTRIDRGSYTEVQARIASPSAPLFVKMSVGSQ